MKKGGFMEGKTQLTKFTFYDLYAELMDTLTDEERGKLLRAMCTYAFEDAPPALTDKKLVYLWGNIVDTLCVDKEAQESGRTPKGLNRQMKHFMFHRNFYEALPLMDDKQAGQYIKAIYNYTFNEQEPNKLASPIDTYFRLAKRKIQIFKVRSKSGMKGGTAERIKVTDEEIEKETSHKSVISFEEFMHAYPHIKNDLYESNKYLINGIDWGYLSYDMETNTELKKCTSLFQLLTQYKRKNRKRK